jgi:hypothetical protein
MAWPGRGRVVAILALVTLGTVACAQAAGSTPSGGEHTQALTHSSPQALAAVRAAVAGASSGTALVRLALTGATAFGGATDVDAAGAFDFPALRGTLSLAPAGGSRESVVFSPTAVYIRPAASGGLLPPGRPWMAANFADSAALARNFPKLIPQVEGINPGLALFEVSSGIAGAEAGGRDLLGGQGAARYDLDIDLRSALASATGPARVAFALALKSQVDALPAPTPAEPARAWVSDAGQLAGLQLPAPGAGVGVVTITFGGAGTALHADPPPAAQVVDVTSITPFGERENQNGGDSDGA